MKQIARWLMIVLLMAFVAGCASTGTSGADYNKVKADNPGLAGGAGDNHPNQRQ